MVRLLRRLVLASLLVGGAVFVIRKRRGPLPAGSSSAVSTHAAATARQPISTPARPFVQVNNTTEAPRWLPPIDGGQCPDGYPIKANASSRIFHVPGGRFYDRTVPERCYAEAEAATEDGYRAAKA
jgi:hypothetical protein